MLSNTDFKIEANKRLGKIINSFTKREIQIILDFIQTSSNLTEEELKDA